MKKRGVFFTIDAILAAAIVVLVIVFLSSYYAKEPQREHISYVSQDSLRTFGSIQLGNFDNEFTRQLIDSGLIARENNTVLEQIGEFWSENRLDYAQNLSKEVADALIPGRYGFGVYVDGEEIYARNKSVARSLISSRKIISGIAKDKPIEGYSSRAFLASVQDKKFSSIGYFGGFVGQGNVSIFIDDIPAGVSLTDMTLEVDGGVDFSLFVNNLQCGGTYTVSTVSFTADSYNISDCLGSINAGQQNNFTMVFSTGLNNAYVGGGFVKVGYLTDIFNSNDSVDYTKKWLPKITGIINLFDSVYISGTPTNMQAYLHYDAIQTNVTNTLYLTIGNKTVVRIPNASGEAIIVLNNSNLSSQLTYASLGAKTVPIRVGFENLSYTTVYDGAADVALITDVSWSMDWRMDMDWVNGNLRNCDSAQLSDTDTRRLSIAKCLDLEFSENIINISGNKIGLIAFEDVTVSSVTVNPTTNRTKINQTIGTSSPLTGYTTGIGTCICCGINSAEAILTDALSATVLVPNGSAWLYYTGGFDEAPAADANGNQWHSYQYVNESSWSTATAIIGSTNSYSYSPPVKTEIGFDLIGSTINADLWEHGADTPGAPNDFSSGILNSSANTYGLAAGNDGWDWDRQNNSGPFEYDDDIDYNNISSGKITFDNNEGGAGNTCSNNDCSGAYGIQVNITPEMYALISGGGKATLSFDYEWSDTAGNVFEDEDQVWTKAQWTSPTSGSHMLGNDLDSGDDGDDSTLEVATAENPDNSYSGAYSQELASWIEGAGFYYLELGGKILTSSSTEHGTWRFDNVQLAVSNATDHYFFRKHFNITNINAAKKGIINVLSDDRAIVYVNGNLIDTDYSSHDAQHWNRGGYLVSGQYLQSGDNVVAVEVINTGDAAKFDLKLIGLNDSRDKAMLVMTDGVANEDGPCPQSGTASEEAIQAACEARQDWGITVYAVGYSSASDEDTLADIAACGEGIYTTSSNITGLQDFYQDVAYSIISTSRQSQTISVEGSLQESKLFGDSYLEINYSPVLEPAEFNEIALQFEENDISNCTFNISIPDDIRVTNALLTSYSSEHWTDSVTIDGQTIYNLSEFSSNYIILGDPFVVQIPAALMTTGNHTITMRTGDVPQNSTGCSLNNSLFYTGLVKSSVQYGSVSLSANGCQWKIETEQGANLTTSVPLSYSGVDSCSFTQSNVSYDLDDSTELATFNLLSQLDFDDNGKINIDIDAADLQIESLFVPNVPSLWGPIIVEIRVWE